LVIVVNFAVLLKTLFLGTLRDQEIENLREKLFIYVLDMLLAMSIFAGEFGKKFFLLFGLLLAVKVFHWIVMDRVDYLGRGTVNAIMPHVRLVVLMTSLLVIDFVVFRDAAVLALAHPSMMILFAFEYALLLISIVSLIFKYVLNCYDIYVEGQWEWKGVITLYLDFIVDVLQLILYFAFFISLLMNFGLPLNLIRQICNTLQSFSKRVASLWRYVFSLLLLFTSRYTRATSDVDRHFPEATREQLENADICIVCRDPLETGRVLRCGHILHRRCLLTWLEQAQTCPTCRVSVFEEENVAGANNNNINNAGGVNNQQQQQQQQRQWEYLQQMQDQLLIQQFLNVRPAHLHPAQLPQWQFQGNFHPPQPQPQQQPQASAQSSQSPSQHPQSPSTHSQHSSPSQLSPSQPATSLTASQTLPSPTPSLPSSPPEVVAPEAKESPQSISTTQSSSTGGDTAQAQSEFTGMNNNSNYSVRSENNANTIQSKLQIGESEFLQLREQLNLALHHINVLHEAMMFNQDAVLETKAICERLSMELKTLGEKK
jgi:E3 ubiquitin-protein ligase synoviolin